MHGWIILDKPLGLGSTQAVGAVKRLLREGGHGKVKVGHGGTLDPLATGVLPIALGEATKLAGRMLDSDKVYEFTIRFGEQTDTLDAEGEVIATSDVRPTPAQVEPVLPRFKGAIEQLPPAYSALKVDGRRAYDLAREGEEVTLAKRIVTVFSLKEEARSSPLTPPGRPGGEVDIRAPDSPPRLRGGVGGGRLCSLTLSAHVSKGTYIRSLARDIALALGTVGHVSMLRRTRAGPFDLGRAVTLDKLRELGQEGNLTGALLPIAAALDGIPALALTPEQATFLRQGRQLSGQIAGEGLALASVDGIPVALVENLSGQIRVVRGFNLDTAKDDE